MSSPANQPPDYGAMIHAWSRHAPWHRRLLARAGLQGKLIFAYAGLLAIALSGSFLLYVNESARMLDRITAQTVLENVLTMAKAGETSLRFNAVANLGVIGADVLHDPDIITVAFYDAAGQPVSVTSRDPAHAAEHVGSLPDLTRDITDLTRVRWRNSAIHGPFAEVTAPMIAVTRPLLGGPPTSKLLGYATVQRSSANAIAHLAHARLLIVLFGGAIFMGSMPLVFWLVHRIFHPIRQLVDATRRIASGDLDAEVAIHRPDAIGALARAFNDMVVRVRRHQTELAAANVELAEANVQLEHRIAQRTRQLESANARLNGEIAEKEDFLRAVSHDLNAPLRNIAGMAAMLLIKCRDRLDEDAIHRLERIQRNVQVETDLINELLELSRIKTRRQKMEEVDLWALVEELRDLFDEDLRARGITLVVDTPLPVLHAERSRIRRVFQNLIDNAIKYMGDGALDPATGNRRREIRIAASVAPDQIALRVADTGMGIEPDDLDKVFFIFRRGRSVAGHPIAGKGVGLAGVKSILETYGGTIRVESQVGAGSTFQFTLDSAHLSRPAQAPANAA